MLDDDKKDLGPFDEEYFDDDDDFLEEPKKDKRKDKKGVAPPPPSTDPSSRNNKNEEPLDFIDDSDDAPVDDFDIDNDLDAEDDDFFPDDKPAVSVKKKKNIALLIIIILVGLYFISEMLSDGPNKKKAKPKNESEEMSEEFRKKSSVPKLTRGLESLANRKNTVERDEKLDNLVVAPPPPPLIEPSSQFINGFEAVNRGGGAGGNNSSLPGLSSPAFPSLSSSGGSVRNNNFGGGGSRSGSGSGSNTLAGGGGRSNSPGLPSLGGGGGLYGGGSNRGGGSSGAIVSEEYRARIQAPMFLMQRPDTEFLVSDQNQVIGSNGLPTREFNLGISSLGSATDASYVGDLSSVILQGKVIDAVIETAINTDLPDSILRGLVTRDVYAEKGRRVLIPKGSRLIGQYSTEVKFGQARVFIIWNRIIRPDGIDAVLDSNSTDLLGRNGVYGKLDNRFFEIFGSSILLSSISIAFAVAANELADPPQQSTDTVTAGGTAIETTDAETEAIKTAVQGLGSQIGDIAEELIDTKPQVLVNQGTKIKIFVNKDIHFPASFTGEDNGVTIIK